MEDSHQLAIRKIHEACNGIRNEDDIRGMFNQEAIDLLFSIGVEYDSALIDQLHLNGIYRSSEIVGYEKKLIDLADKKYRQQPPDYDGIDNKAIRDDIQNTLDSLQHEKYCIAMDDEPIMFDDGNDYSYYQSLLIPDDSYLLDILSEVAKGLGSTEAP